MTATLVRPARAAERFQAIAQARAAHLEFADVVAGLDLDDRTVWTAAERAVARVSAEANGVTSALTGQRWMVAEPGLPPVVRVRELSVAQRRMDAALESAASSTQFTELVATLKGSADRVSEAARWLTVLTAAAE